MPRVRLWLAPLFAIALVTSGCNDDHLPPKTQRYSDSARIAYEAAIVAFEDHDWENATSMFEQIKREYGYSRYSRLAELRLADIAFQQNKYPEAVTAYRSFTHDHPNDPEVAYARYRSVKALFEQAGDNVLLPPLEERDLASVIDAHTAIRSFLSDYPTYTKVPELEYMLSIVTGLLARHELYVARYYEERDNLDAAILRAKAALERYPGSGLDAEALVLLGECYLKAKRYTEAKEAFNLVLSHYASSPFTETAKRFLAHADDLGNDIDSRPLPQGP